MDELRVTLVGDGSFDRALLPIVSWVIRERGVRIPLRPYWADLACLQPRPASLTARLASALDLYPCDLLFVHRDAENKTRGEREAEISKALARSGTGQPVPHVPVIPVRMTEAWLLFDPALIRGAAGNPRGTVPLAMLGGRDWDKIVDPKDVLRAALLEASELGPRRRASFNASEAARLVATRATDFSALRRLAAFRDLETDTLACLETLGVA